jgi:hypothetical protein
MHAWEGTFTFLARDGRLVVLEERRCVEEHGTDIQRRIHTNMKLHDLEVIHVPAGCSLEREVDSVAFSSLKSTGFGRNLNLLVQESSPEGSFERTTPGDEAERSRIAKPQTCGRYQISSLHVLIVSTTQSVVARCCATNKTLLLPPASCCTTRQPRSSS